MKIEIGANYFKPDEKIIYDSENTVNGHWVILGASGVGKTHFLRRLLGEFKTAPNLRIHIFDSHGDIFTDENYTSLVKFSESSEYGVNPFQISADPDFGGVRKRVNSFISMVNRNTGKIGQRQEGVLRSLLYDMYAKHGFFYTKPDSWKSEGKKVPTMLDLKKIAQEKMKKLVIGNFSRALSALDELSKKTPKLEKQMHSSERDNDEIDKLKVDIKEAFCVFIDNLSTGRELDEYLRYQSKDVLQSTYNRIENLYSSGVFKDKPPSFHKSRPIWRYDIRALSDAEKGFLIELYLEKIFFMAKKNGLSRAITNYIVIDEAQNFMTEESDHIINIMMRESRKFGLAFVFALQNFSKFPEDVIINAGSKLILGVDEFHHELVARKCGVEIKRLRAIKPRKTGLIQIKNHSTYMNNNYFSVVFP